MQKKQTLRIDRQWFIDSKQGNIKDDYFFEKKLGSGGYGAVYLAKNKKSGIVLLQQWHTLTELSRSESSCESYAEDAHF